MRRRVISRCTCGRVKSKRADKCDRCYNLDTAAYKAEAISVVALGKCPECGTKLYRNGAIAGWWQCGAYPCAKLRLSEHLGLPYCSFQCFTE